MHCAYASCDKKTIVGDLLWIVPSGVASLVVAERGSNHLTLVWTPPEFPNGILLDYKIEYGIGEYHRHRIDKYIYETVCPLNASALNSSSVIVISFSSPTVSFIPDLKTSFSSNPSHCSLSFSSSGLTT